MTTAPRRDYAGDGKLMEGWALPPRPDDDNLEWHMPPSVVAAGLHAWCRFVGLFFNADN
jgi:hypothetical protein